MYIGTLILLNLILLIKKLKVQLRYNKLKLDNFNVKILQ